LPNKYASKANLQLLVKNPSYKLEKNKTGSSLNISLSKKLATALLLSIVNLKKSIRIV
jgi:hypothetical protein